MEWTTSCGPGDAAAIREAKEELAEEIEFFRFIQYKFQQQWKKLKSYAHKKGIRIIGDLPIYVASDSADAWANPRLFSLTRITGRRPLPDARPTHFPLRVRCGESAV